MDTFKDNKEEAMKYICKEMGENVEKLKLQVGCFSNIALKQFNHISKYIGEQLKSYFESIKEKNKEIVEEGLTISKIAAELEEKKVCSADEFIKWCHDPNVVSSYEIEGESLEGFLFPDTYFFISEMPEPGQVRISFLTCKEF